MWAGQDFIYLGSLLSMACLQSLLLLADMNLCPKYKEYYHCTQISITTMHKGVQGYIR